MAIQIGKYLFQRIRVRPYCTPVEAKISPRYIPEKMPSHKCNGTRVEGPLAEKSVTGIFRIMQANDLARLS
jgi:hypothetical protein